MIELDRERDEIVRESESEFVKLQIEPCGKFKTKVRRVPLFTRFCCKTKQGSWFELRLLNQIDEVSVLSCLSYAFSSVKGIGCF